LLCTSHGTGGYITSSTSLSEPEHKPKQKDAAPEHWRLKF
jgi:hypothetical protein